MKKGMFLSAVLSFLVFPFIAEAKSSNSSVNAMACHEISSLHYEQLEVLRFSYQHGQAFDLGYTLAAIAWVESQAGLYPINVTDPSFGVHHVNLRSAIRRSDMKDTPFNRNRLAGQLLQINTSADYALKELLYWQEYRSSWRDVVSSYNAGWKMENGRAYLRKVIDKVNLLTRCADEWMPVSVRPDLAFRDAA